MIDVETIKARGLCSGCGMCAGIGEKGGKAIEMRVSPEGFRRPYVTGKVPQGDAAIIDAACPGLNIRHEPQSFEADYHPKWGPVLKSRLGWSSDPAMRHNASSGGGLSAILDHLLAAGEVDYVVHTGVSPASPVRNELTISTSAQDVFSAAGSRYAPSSPLEDIGTRLDAPGRFAFVGKPCDVAGLRQLGRIDARVAEKVPVMIAFMCGGVPSYRGTSALLKAMGVEDESEVVSFRYRGDGWPGFATAELADGRRLTMDYDTSWGKILNRHLQFRCKICPDGIGEFADITCADGWHLDDEGKPIFAEREGRSIILTRTKAGEAVVGRAMDAGKLVAETVPIAEVELMQAYQAKRKGLVATRLAAMTAAGRKRPRYRNLALARGAVSLKPVEALRSTLGMLRRLLREGKGLN